MRSMDAREHLYQTSLKWHLILAFLHLLLIQLPVHTFYLFQYLYSRYSHLFSLRLQYNVVIDVSALPCFTPVIFCNTFSQDIYICQFSVKSIVHITQKNLIKFLFLKNHHHHQKQKPLPTTAPSLLH